MYPTIMFFDCYAMNLEIVVRVCVKRFTHLCQEVYLLVKYVYFFASIARSGNAKFQSIMSSVA